MKKTFLIFIAVLSTVTILAQPQCLMTANIDANASVIMTCPNGTVRTVSDSVVLEEYGKYSLLATVDDAYSVRDTFSLSFILDGKEKYIEVSLSSKREPKDTIQKVFFNVTRHLNPQDVKIVSFYNETKGDFPGPVFTVYNGSIDTIYGQWLPNYLWGWVEVLNDGIPILSLNSNIDINFVEGEPLIPNGFFRATIGSFGRPIRTGNYRFHLLYCTQWQGVGYSTSRETVSHRWYTSNKSWYHLTYDFEI